MLALMGAVPLELPPCLRIPIYSPAQFASMLPNTASGTSISVTQSSISSMTPIATTAPLQLGPRSQVQPNNINQAIESAEIEILPPPSYDVVTGTPSAANLTFPTSVSGSFNTTLSSAIGPVTPPPSTRVGWYPPEKGRPYPRTFGVVPLLIIVLNVVSV